jgi:hypothetical protein
MNRPDYAIRWLVTGTLALVMFNACELASAAQMAVAMQSDEFEYVGAGRSYFYDVTSAEFEVSTQPYTVLFQMRPFNSTAGSWLLAFGTGRFDVPLEAMHYADVMRWNAPESDGHPQMMVFGEGRGLNELTGNFTVLELDFSDPDALRLAIDFEQHGVGDPQNVLRGRIRFNSMFPIPEPASSAMLVWTLAFALQRRRRVWSARRVSAVGSWGMVTTPKQTRWAAMFKFLRVPVTALSLTACLLLIALWLRS